ncbi:enamine deaminase RidA (YjgF/YER057c/UK114 family) [Pseudomonas sp. JUb42]|jgi:enamine deaminase RidA (YjgF/YER057c/UK114 family)|uniref:RidA family protein n=1 Tax=Pseudomonas sp. JUb42 TaxID=2940611 RepID=UPI0021695471|nr:RidA family protein [Pseudomonas sp. JUb42]MCS3468872.1 enamine deaminase RidA (YjgF/YER057c/UK114 family) [Pseudomonas sp. JUb42]
MSSDQRFQQAAEEMGYSFDGEIKIGGNYVPLVRHEQQIYVSGQIPRVGDTVVVTGRVGEATTLEVAQLGAKISTMRALALLQRSLGSLEAVKGILRIGVYVQCSMDFTQHSEVADAASDLLSLVLGDIGSHTRTSVGVYQLPKNASVEVEMIAVV